MAYYIHRMSLLVHKSYRALALLVHAALAGCTASHTVQYTVSSATQFVATASPTDGTLYLDVQGLLWRIPTDGASATALSTARDDLRKPRVSPDGSRIVAQSFRRGHWDLVLLDRGGAHLAELTDGPFDARDPVWSPSGDALYFAADKAGGYDIWKLELVTRELQQVTRNAGDEYAPTVANGELVFVATSGGKPALYSLPLDATAAEPTALEPAAEGTVIAPRLSPDGRRLAWVEAFERSGFPGIARNRLVVLDRDTGLRRTLSAPASDVFSMPPSWITSDEVLYTADGGPRVASVNGSKSPRVLPLALPLSAERQPHAIRPAPAFSDASLPALGIVDPVWLADDSVVFTALGDLWRQFADGSLTRLTDDAWVERDLALAPDGHTLAYISDRNAAAGMQIWLHDLRTGARNMLTDRAAGPRYPTFAPDGRRLAYFDVGPRGTQDFTLRVVNLSSGQQRRLRSAPRAWPGRIAWSTTGTHLTIAALTGTSARFAGGRNVLVRIDVEADRAAPLDLGGLTPDFGPVAAPDGRTLALIIDGTLWRLPLAADGRPAGPPAQVLDALVESPTWSRDGRRLLVLGPQGLTSLPAAGLSAGAMQTRNPALESVAARPAGRTLIHAGRVFTGRGDRYLDNVDILIDANRIVSVRPHGAHPADAALVDASEQTVLPGLIDHHVHFEGHKGEVIGRSLLAFGITTVVEPGGLPYESRERFEAWRGGHRPGPRLVYAGPQLDGRARVFPFAAHVTNATRLQRELERADRLGYGMIKTYTRLPPDLQQAAVAGAHARGLPVSAHTVTRNVGFGGDRSEHLRGSSRVEYSDKQSAILRSYADIEQTLANTGATLTPTLVNQGAFFRYWLEHPEVADNRQYATLYPAAYRNNLAAFARIVARRRPLIDAGVSNAQASIRRLQVAGVRIVAGTDAPIFPYGLSLVIELASYVEAGLSPAEALRTATSDAAAELGVEDRLGRVEPGMLADLLIVNGDPLAAIDSLANVAGVVLNGRYLSLDRLLEPQPSAE